MSENKPEKIGFIYNFFKATVFIGVPVGSYLILGWGFFQILGAIFVMTMAFELDEKGPVLRRWIWALLTFDVMILGHFYINDTYLAWGLVVLSSVLVIIILMIFNAIREYKTGDGSTITFYFLGLIVVIPITGLVIFNTLAAFGYL